MSQFCQQCGQPLKPGAAFCASCGAHVNANAAAPQPNTPVTPPPPPAPNVPPAMPQPQAAPIYVQAPPRNSSLKALLWIGLGAVGVILLIFIATIFFRAGQESTDASSFTPPSYTSTDQQPNSDANTNTDTTPPAPTIDIAPMQAVISKNNDLLQTMQTAVNQIDVESTDDVDRMATQMRIYVSAAQQIDTQSCPRDFAEAFSRYLTAWTDAADTVSAHPYIPTGDDATVYGFLRGLNGDPTGGAVQLQDEAEDWFKQVQAKRAAIDQAKGDWDALAARYGAK